MDLLSAIECLLLGVLFLFLSIHHIKLHKRIDVVEERVAELEQGRVSDDNN